MGAANVLNAFATVEGSGSGGGGSSNGEAPAVPLETRQKFRSFVLDLVRDAVSVIVPDTASLAVWI